MDFKNLTLCVPVYKPSDCFYPVILKIIFQVLNSKYKYFLKVKISVNGRANFDNYDFLNLISQTYDFVTVSVHPENIGYDKNFLSLFDLNDCDGFTWPLGDDDMIEDSIIDYVFENVNYSNAEVLYVGGNVVNNFEGLCPKFEDFCKYTKFQIGGMSATVYKNSIIKKFINEYDITTVRHWVHLNVILYYRNEIKFYICNRLSFSEVLFTDKRWLSDFGGKDINEELFRATDLREYSNYDFIKDGSASIQIKKVIFDSIIVRLIKDKLFCRNALSVVNIYKRYVR